MTVNYIKIGGNVIILPNVHIGTDAVIGAGSIIIHDIPAGETIMQELHLTQEWDKVFPKSDQVDHKKVTFTNHFGSGPIHTKELRR